MAVLRAQNLSKSYKKRPIIRDVSLSVESGAIVGLLGPNGAGKTTCFYMIVGLVEQDGGEIFIDEESITNLPMHGRAQKGIGYLPQELANRRGEWTDASSEEGDAEPDSRASPEA